METGLRFSSRNFDKLLLPVKCTFCRERREFAGAEPSKEADSGRGQQRAAFRICGACREELLCLWYG